MHSLANIAKYAGNPEIARDKGQSLANILTELQGFKIAVVDGAGANTNIAIAGIALVDTIKFVVELPAAYVVANILDRTSIASITSAGNIQLTSSTSGSRLIVGYLDQA